MTQVIGIAPHKEGDTADDGQEIDLGGGFVMKIPGSPDKVKKEEAPLAFIVVEDAYMIVDEKDGDTFVWKKGTEDAPHYKAYAYGLDIDGDLVSGTGLGDSYEDAAQDAVDWLQWMISE